jgi:hypothetical protein
MSSQRLDPGRAGQNEQSQPYEGKHRAPESRSWGLVRRVADMVLDQQSTAPHQLPDPPASGNPEVPGDQDPAKSQQ